MTGAGTGEPPTTPRLTPGRRRLAWLLAWLAATALLWLSFRRVPLGRAAALLTAAHPAWLLAAVASNLAIVALWTAQSLVLVPRARRAALGAGAYGRMFEVMALTTTATNTVPAFLGQASGVVLMAERAGIGVAASLAVLAQHQAVEGIAKVATLLLAAAAAPLPPAARRAVALFTAAAAALLVALLVLARRAAPQPPVDGGRAPSRLTRLVAAIRRWGAGLEALREPPRFAAALALALLMKVAEAGGHAAVLRALDVRAPAATPVVALAAVNLASSVAASPGNLGTYEAGAVFAYRRMGIAADHAAALALTAHLCYLVPLVGTGWLLLGVRQLARRRG